MFDFGLRIRELREHKKISQQKLGEMIGRSKSVISSYENNIKIPPLSVLVQMAVVFNVSLDYLVGIDKNEMISINGLNDQQKELVHTVIFELKDNQKTDGLTSRQEEILNILMKEFLNKRK